jgi:hypothetical protein
VMEEGLFSCQRGSTLLLRGTALNLLMALEPVRK